MNSNKPSAFIGEPVADVEPASRTLTAKLVYYGPALSVKTTNALALHNRLQENAAGEQRDLPDVMPAEELRPRWGATGVPLLLASALHTRGVAETFEALLGALHTSLEPTLGLGSRWGVSPSELEAGALGPEAQR